MARGGKRVGAGRKPNALTKRTRAIAEKAEAEGKTPLEVMLDNMRHFQQVALDAEHILEGLTAEEYSGKSLKPDEQFKLLLAEVKKAAGFRQMAQECARDAASYMHPRLAAIQHTGANGTPLFDPAKLNDEQLATLEKILATFAGAGPSGDSASEAKGQLH